MHIKNEMSKILCLSCYILFLFAKSLDYLWIAYINFSNSSTWCLKLFLPNISVYFLIWPSLIIQISLKYLFVSNICPFFLTSIFLLECLSLGAVQILHHHTWFLKGYCNTLYLYSLFWSGSSKRSLLILEGMLLFFMLFWLFLSLLDM